MKKIIAFVVTLISFLTINAQTVEVKDFNYAGPFNVRMPIIIDSLDINSKKFSQEALLDAVTDISVVNEGTRKNVLELPRTTDNTAVHLIAFNFNNNVYAKVDIKVEGLGKTALFVDGKKTEGKKVELIPADHQVVVKYLTDSNKQEDEVKVSLKADKENAIALKNSDEGRFYQITDVLNCWRFNNVDISPDGNFIIVGYYMIQKDGKTTTKTIVKNIRTGAVVDQKTAAFWMPNSNRYCFVRIEDGNRILYAADPITHEEQIIAKNIPEGSFQMAPTEDYLLFTRKVQGPKEDKDVYQVVNPEDRQPGWRDRTALDIYDMNTKMTNPLTFGYHSVALNDISADGNKILIASSGQNLLKRPTNWTSIFLIDLKAYKVDTLVLEDGFVDYAKLSPDARQLMIVGSPEALGGIGNVVPQGRTPSMVDKQIFIMDIESKSIKPMTKNFNPSVNKAVWSKADNMIYFSAEDKDCVRLFKMNPKDGKINVVNVPEELIEGFDCADNANEIAVYAQSASNSDRMYSVNTLNNNATLIEDLSKETLKNIQLGECHPWNYINDRGDYICCRYYLPPNFNRNKKYPMIVNYYGGCSPTSRHFESRYPHHAYAAQGYVVFIVNPSGATGFGQEFSSRHVNTAGEGVAEDIIGATKDFCSKNRFVDTEHIGCIGASYGGFMTQYLQTKTDIFAAAISHAGISDHTSYWGEGYWGYSYSEVSMANSYPWTDKQLYVEQSPLFNADKINTPILFLHGDMDTNVPVGESIQMFTALKLLGKETAMVLVKDQNHHITDYSKRIKWQNTIFAWFAKYLKNDPSWWNAIYKQPEE